jgi:hypothetical protein
MVCKLGSHSEAITYTVNVAEQRTEEATGIRTWTDEASKDWRKLHSQNLYNLLPSPNVVTVIKSRRIYWPGQKNYRASVRGKTQFL